MGGGLGEGLGSGSGSAIFLGGGGDEARVRVWARQNFLEKASGFKVHVTFGFGLSRTAVGAGMFRLAFGLRFRSAALYGMTLAPDPLMSTIVPY